MTTNLNEQQFHTFLNNKIGKTGFVTSKKDFIGQTIKDIYTSVDPDKKKWTQIHSDKIVTKGKGSYLQHLLEKESLSDIPIRLVKTIDKVKTQKVTSHPNYDNSTYLNKTTMEIITYQLFLSFNDNTEYMIHLNDTNEYFLLLDKPELYQYYRIQVLSTGKYIFYISKSYLKLLVDNKNDKICDIDPVLVSLIKQHQVQGNPGFNILHNKIIPCALSFPVKNSLELTDTYLSLLKEPLLSHQIDNISWMVYLEKLISLNMTLLDYVNTQGMIEFRIGREHYYTNHSYYHIFDRNSLTKTPRHESILMRGGILADEAGMGKTRSVLGLVLADIIYPNDININGQLLAKLLPNYLNKEINMTGNIHTLNLDMFEDEDKNKLSCFNNILEQNTHKLCQTLIVAPTHIVDIWQEELGELTGFDVKHIVLSNITHVKKLDIQNLSNYNLVILSSGLLVNKRYTEHINLHNEYDFRNYLWHRVVVDESDEIFRMETIQQHIDSKTQSIQHFLLKINSLSRWCITATPFQNHESNLGGYIRFLSCSDNKDIIYNLNIDDIKKLIRCYFRRHDKQKMIEALPMTTIKEELVYLKQSGIEKAIYQSALRKYNKLRLMQLCTHVQISEEEIKILGNFAGHKIMSLDDIEKSMLKYFTLRTKKLEKDTEELEIMSKHDKEYRNKIIEDINQSYLNNKKMNVSPEDMANLIKTSSRVQYIYSLLDDYLNEYGYQKIIGSLEECQIHEIWTILHINHEIMTKHEEIFNSKTKENKREIQTLTNQMGLFKQSYISESVKEPCFICYQHFDKVIITECRHIFCGKCMKMLFQNKKTINCPLCRRNINADDIKVTDIKLIKKAEYMENLKDEDIMKYGTKIAFLIQKTRTLLETKENRIVIFSQWSSMLNLISNVFTEFNIDHLTSKGNLSSIKATMNRFEHEDSRVLLLNPDSCIVGNDLTVASHIIMTDVLMMNKTNAKILENQLMGYIQRIGENKEISLIRLVTSDTIEEEYLKKQK